jgi:hypothetical protein
MNSKRGLRRPRTRFVGAVLIAALGLSGCSSLGVKAFDRDLLATRAMQLNTHPHITAFNEHVYFSREGSSGGRTFDGGGCGCN